MPPQNILAYGGDAGVSKSPEEWQRLLRSAQPAQQQEPQTAGGFGMSDYTQFINNGASATNGYGQPVTKAMFDEAGVSPSQLGMTISFNTASRQGKADADAYFASPSRGGQFGQQQPQPTGSFPGAFNANDMMGSVRTAQRFDPNTGTMREMPHQGDLQTMWAVIAKQQEEQNKFNIAKMNADVSAQALGVKSNPNARLIELKEKQLADFMQRNGRLPTATESAFLDQSAMDSVRLLGIGGQGGGQGQGQQPQAGSAGDVAGRIGSEMGISLMNAKSPEEFVPLLMSYDKLNPGYVQKNLPILMQQMDQKFGPDAMRKFTNPGFFSGLGNYVGAALNFGWTPTDESRNALQNAQAGVYGQRPQPAVTPRPGYQNQSARQFVK